MSLLPSMATILGALLLGAISPGPSFVMVARTSIALSRRNGMAAAVGMGVGGVVFATLALLGLHVLLTSVTWLDFALKLIGGLYLLYLAIRFWQGAASPLVVSGPDDPHEVPFGKSFLLALTTQVSNPKTLAFYSSIFAALLPPNVPTAMLFLLPPLVFVVEAGWYAVVVMAFSSPSPRAAYLRAKTLIDRMAGAVMGLLGLKLILEARRALL